MDEGSEMREYKQGDTVQLRVRVQDPSGVHSVNAYAFHEGTGPGATPPATQEEQISLGGVPPEQGSAPVDVDMHAPVTTQVPGVYVCREIWAYDTLQRHTIYPLEPPRRFRIVESAEDDREGPEVLEVGDFS